MRYKVRTDKWGVPRLHEGDFGYGNVAEAVKAYSRNRRDDMRENLALIREELADASLYAARAGYGGSRRRRFRNANLYLNRLSNVFRKIRMANKILEEHNGDNRG
jgi:hypothetical protein